MAKKLGKITFKRGGRAVLAALGILLAVDALVLIVCSIWVNGPEMWTTIVGEIKASWLKWMGTYVTLDILFGIAFGLFVHGVLDKKLHAVDWTKINKLTTGLYMGGVTAGLNLAHFLGVVIIAKMGELLKTALTTNEKLHGLLLFIVVMDLVLAGVGFLVYKFKVVDDTPATP